MSHTPTHRMALAVAAGAIAATSVRSSAQDAPADGAISANFLHADGVETAPFGTLGHVEVRGEGPIHLVLFPGAAFGWTVWDEFMTRNAERYTMHAITPAGYDGTKPPPMPADPAEFSDLTWTDALVAGAADHLRRAGVERAIAVGHHLMGDHYAMRMAVDHPDLVGGVVVIAGAPSRPARSSSEPAEQLGATRDEQIEAVERQWKPFFGGVTWETWLNGTYKGPAFSNDARRGEALYAQQISVPLPTQLRYFLEYLTTNIAPEVIELDPPMLVVQPYGDPDGAIESGLKQLADQGLTPEEIQERVDKFLDANFGGDMQAFRDSVRLSPLWEAMEAQSENLRLQYIEDSAIFVMDDQAELLDRLIAEFAAGLVD